MMHNYDKKKLCLDFDKDFDLVPSKILLCFKLILGNNKSTKCIKLSTLPKKLR